MHGITAFAAVLLITLTARLTDAQTLDLCGGDPDGPWVSLHNDMGMRYNGISCYEYFSYETQSQVYRFVAKDINNNISTGSYELTIENLATPAYAPDGTAIYFPTNVVFDPDQNPGFGIDDPNDIPPPAEGSPESFLGAGNCSYYNSKDGSDNCSMMTLIAPTPWCQRPNSLWLFPTVSSGRSEETV